MDTFPRPAWECRGRKARARFRLDQPAGMGLLELNGVSWTRHGTPNGSRVRRLLIDDRDGETRFWLGSTNQFGYFQREADGAMV